jgi:hypothetical protein
MSAVAIAALVVLAAVLVAGAITLRGWGFGYATDRAALRRCFLAWLAGLLAEGALLWWLTAQPEPVSPAWMLVAIGLPLIPPSVYLYHDYAPIPAATLIAQSAFVSAAWIAAAGSVALLWPHVGAWGLAVPAIMGAAAAYWYVRQDASRKETVVALVVVGALIAAVSGLLMLLEWLGLAIL